MKIYAVDSWIPYSEYGGLEVWAAQDKEELKSLMLSAAENEAYSSKRTYSNWKELVIAAADDARELDISKAGLLAEFVT